MSGASISDEYSTREDQRIIRATYFVETRSRCSKIASILSSHRFWIVKSWMMLVKRHITGRQENAKVYSWVKVSKMRHQSACIRWRRMVISIPVNISRLFDHVVGTMAPKTKSSYKKTWKRWRICWNCLRVGIRRRTCDKLKKSMRK